MTVRWKGSLCARQLRLSILLVPATVALYHPESVFLRAESVSVLDVPVSSDQVILSAENNHLYSRGSSNVPSFVKSAVSVAVSLAHISFSPSIVTGGAQRCISISSMAKSLPPEEVHAFLITSLMAVLPDGTVKFIPTKFQCAELRHSPGIFS